MRQNVCAIIAMSLYLLACGKGGNSNKQVIHSGGIVTTLAGLAGSSGTTDGIGSIAKFYNPLGIAYDSGNLYVVDGSNFTIRKIVITSGMVTTEAGVVGVTGSTDGVATNSKFNHPEGITVLGNDLYITDTLNFTIRKMTIGSGIVSTLAGSAGNSGSADGALTSARFLGPAGITNDGNNLYVADTDNSTIRKINLLSDQVETVAGRASSPGDVDGAGLNARFTSPYGIACDGNNLYVSDINKHTIRKISLNGSWTVTTLAGSSGNSGSVDGAGSNARFNTPKEIATDGISLYVADSGNQTIRKVDIATGVVSTLAGLAGSTGVTDGTGNSARFFTPTGITHDGINLYVTDANGQAVREIK